MSDRIVKYTGTLYHEDGTEEEVKDRTLQFVCYEPGDRSVGIMTDYLGVCDPEKIDDIDDSGYGVDPYAFFEQECEQTGGHNFVDHQWSEEPESACQICSRCGKEIDPA